MRVPKWKEPIWKDRLLYNFSSVAFWKRRNY